MALYRHLATAVVCSFVLFIAIILDQPFFRYNASLHGSDQAVAERSNSSITVLSPEKKVAVSFHDHGSSPGVTPRIVPRMNSDGSDDNDDDVMEMDPELEDGDGDPMNELRQYDDAAFRGNQHHCLMNASPEEASEMVKLSDKWQRRPLQSVYSRPQQEFKNWGWEFSLTSLWEDSPEKFMSSDFDKYGLVRLMDSLGLSTDVKHWSVAKVAQAKDWSMNGKTGPALLDIQGRPHYWYQLAINGGLQDSSARTIILPFMKSPSIQRIQKLPEFRRGTLPPDLKACSDLVYLMYYLFTTSIDFTVDPGGGPDVRFPAPKYFVIPGVETAEVVDVFKHIFKQNNLGYVDAPGKKWAADSQEGKALIGTLHGAAISFFLIQHKQQFGVKAITSLSVWHTKWSVEESETWHMWVEIGDPEPALVDEFLDEHADWGQTVAKGSDLLCMMRMTLKKAQEWASKSRKWGGLTVQSNFYDPNEMEHWGWVDMPGDLDFYDITQHFFNSLGLAPTNKDNWRSVAWDHDRDWTFLGKSGPSVYGSTYTTFFNKDKTQPVLLGHMMFSPNHIVEHNPSLGPAPDLSKPSDVWFLQWYQHGLLHLGFPPVVSRSRIPAPRHIFIQNVATEEVQLLFDDVVQIYDKEHAGDIRSLGGGSFDPEDEIGKLLLGTRHGAAVCMFLIQHKEQFGDQTVTAVRLWETRHWHIDFEIGEVEKDDSDPMEMGKRGVFKAKL